MSDSEQQTERDRDSQRPADEPEYMPSQAEGAADDEDEMVPHLRTPGKAEGKEEDVEEQLQRQEDKNRPRRDR